MTSHTVRLHDDVLAALETLRENERETSDDLVRKALVKARVMKK